MPHDALEILEIDELISQGRFNPECYNAALEKTVAVMINKLHLVSLPRFEQNPLRGFKAVISDDRILLISGSVINGAFYFCDFLETLTHELINHLPRDENVLMDLFLDASEEYCAAWITSLVEGGTSYADGLIDSVRLFQEEPITTEGNNPPCQCLEY